MSDAGSHLSGLSEAQTESIIPTSNVPWRERDSDGVQRADMSFKHTQGRNLKMLDIDWFHIYTGSIPCSYDYVLVLLKFCPITDDDVKLCCFNKPIGIETTGCGMHL